MEIYGLENWLKPLFQTFVHISAVLPYRFNILVIWISNALNFLDHFCIDCVQQVYPCHRTTRKSVACMAIYGFQQNPRDCNNKDPCSGGFFRAQNQLFYFFGCTNMATWLWNVKIAHTGKNIPVTLSQASFAQTKFPWKRFRNNFYMRMYMRELAAFFIWQILIFPEENHL
jgi:hypothetical protein